MTPKTQNYETKNKRCSTLHKAEALNPKDTAFARSSAYEPPKIQAGLAGLRSLAGWSFSLVNKHLNNRIRMAGEKLARCTGFLQRKSAHGS